MLCLRAESVLFAENTMLLHLPGENTFVPDTLRVASLYVGLCADCPLRDVGFAFSAPLLALRLLHLRKKVVTLHLSIKSILFNSIFYEWGHLICNIVSNIVTCRSDGSFMSVHLTPCQNGKETRTQHHRLDCTLLGYLSAMGNDCTPCVGRLQKETQTRP